MPYNWRQGTCSIMSNNGKDQNVLNYLFVVLILSIIIINNRNKSISRLQCFVQFISSTKNTTTNRNITLNVLMAEIFAYSLHSVDSCTCYSLSQMHKNPHSSQEQFYFERSNWNKTRVMDLNQGRTSLIFAPL